MMIPNNEQVNTPLGEVESSHAIDPTVLPEGNSVDVVLGDLQKQVRIIQELKPSISELAKLYQDRKSRIDQFAEWYSSKPLSEKIILGGVVVSTSYAVGALLGAAWLLVGLVTGLYAAATSILEEHGKFMRNRDAFTGDGAQKMEDLIGASIDAFRLLEDKLNHVFQSLSEQHVQRSEGIFRLEGHVDALGDHNLRYASVIESVNNTVEKFVEHQEGVALTEVEMNALSSEFQISLDGAKNLCSTLSGLVTSVEKELNSEVVAEAPDVIDETPSAQETIARSDQVIGDACNTLSKLRQAAKARKTAYAVQDELGVFSSRSYCTR